MTTHQPNCALNKIYPCDCSEQPEVKAEGKECKICNGSGGISTPDNGSDTCPDCNGSGFISSPSLESWETKLQDKIIDLVWSMTDGGCKLTKSQFNHFEEPLIEWGDIKSLLSSEKAKAKEQWKKEVLEKAPLKQDRNMSMFTNPVFYDGYNRAIEDYKKIIENY